MPIYEYRCNDCNQIFEEWQKDFGDRQYPCPICGGESERLISNTSFVLKGSGWYVTDYCGKNAASAANGNGGNGGNGSNGSNGSAKKTEETKTSSTDAAPATDSSSTTTT